MGEPDEDGVYPDYRIPAELKPAAPERGVHVTWGQIASQWLLVRADLAALYGVREWEMHSEPWTVLRGLVFTVLSHPQSQAANALGLHKTQ